MRHIRWQMEFCDLEIGKKRCRYPKVGKFWMLTSISESLKVYMKMYSCVFMHKHFFRKNNQTMWWRHSNGSEISRWLFWYYFYHSQVLWPHGNHLIFLHPKLTHWQMNYMISKGSSSSKVQRSYFLHVIDNKSNSTIITPALGSKQGKGQLGWAQILKINTFVFWFNGIWVLNHMAFNNKSNLSSFPNSSSSNFIIHIHGLNIFPSLVLTAFCSFKSLPQVYVPFLPF